MDKSKRKAEEVSKPAAKKLRILQDDDDSQFDQSKDEKKRQILKEVEKSEPKKKKESSEKTSSLGKKKKDGHVAGKKAKEEAEEEGRKKKGNLEDEELEKLRKLEKEVLINKEKLNNLVQILAFVQSSHDRVIFTAIHSLSRIFTPYIEEGRFKGTSEATADKEAKVLAWINDKYQAYLAGLLKLLDHKEQGLQLPAMKLLFSLLLSETTGLSKVEKQYTFANEFFLNMLTTWIACENFSQAAINLFLDDYVNKYQDIRYYTLKNLGKLANSVNTSTLDQFSTRVLDLLQKIEMPEEDEQLTQFLTGNTPSFGLATFDADNRKRDHKPATQEAVKHIVSTQSGLRRVFGDCWVSFLKLSLPVESFKRVLVIMYRQIIPYMSHPTHLMDFLTDSYNQGGVVSILALNGLFILITKHNLDYPDFYQKLYVLLEKSVTHVKYRARFFRMLELFLQSPLLPSYLVGAFMKRLCRLLLTAPPAGCMVILPLVYNLLLRHPSCAPLIHRVTETKPGILAIPSEETQSLTDPFDFEERDPHKSNAMASSLWELTVIKQHYCPQVAKFVRVFEEVFRMQPFQMDKYLDNTYETLMRTELRTMKDAPALNDDMPKFLFPKDGSFSTWDFTPIEEYID